MKAPKPPRMFVLAIGALGLAAAGLATAADGGRGHAGAASAGVPVGGAGIAGTSRAKAPSVGAGIAGDAGAGAPSAGAASAGVTGAVAPAAMPGTAGAAGVTAPVGAVPGGRGAATAAGTPNSGAGGASGQAGADAATVKRLAALRKKVLKDEDFVENDEINRDPFHSYLRLFVDHSTPKTRKVPAVFDKVGLEELTLIAIISGDDTPRAMFRDATGLGQSVKKGEFLSRAGARVTKILSDRVIVEISEQSGTGDVRVVEKAILVNPDEAP